MKSKPTVLIVEDSIENVDLLVNILEESYEISVALNGEEALSYVYSQKPDLILLDIVMPKLDGYTICRRLKKNLETKNIPIIFITAKNSSSSEREGLEIGAVDYITKPIVPEVVIARVKNHIELKMAREKLEKQNEQLKSLMEMREQLSNMVVHDIRSPISTILGACEFIQMDGINEDTMSFIDDIQQQAERASLFADDLLMLAKAEENKLAVNLADIDIVTIVESVVKNYAFVLEAKKIKVENKYSSFRKFSVDKQLFNRLMDNLISNSIKYSPTGETITIKLNITCQESHKYLHIQVCDRGMGITDENKDKIFNKFQIVDMKSKDVNQVGLGLTFCKMVVDAHKGKIYVTDNDPGSIFNIELTNTHSCTVP